MDSTKRGCDNSGGLWRSSTNKKLFGREREIEQLDQILARHQENDASSSSSLIVIRGVAGSGKSSIVESYPWSSKGYCLAMGKFDSHRTAEPYSAVLQALESLVEQWVLDDTIHNNITTPPTPTTTKPLLEETAGEEEKDDEEEDQEDDHGSSSKKMEQFQQLLATDGKVLKNIIPSILRIAGIEELQQTPHDTTCTTKRTKSRPSSAPARTRGVGCFFSTDGEDGDVSSTSTDAVNAAFRRIVTFLCAFKPVVLCLDDSQWADEASLSVIQALVSSTIATGNIPGLLLAVTYREEEVDKQHTLSSRLEEVKGSGLVEVHDIHIQDLDVESLNALVAYLVRREEHETLALTEVIQQQTAGNPFFVLELMTLLQHEKFLRYSYSTLRWEWGDVDKIQNLANISDNVADVVAASIQRLPGETQVALSVASCLGRKVVPLDVLKEYFDSLVEGEESASVQVLEQIQDEGVENVLDCAVQSGILIRNEDASQEASRGLKWSHDKLQQFAYVLIPSQLRASLHMRLGKLLWKMSETRPEEDWMVFTAADQLNRFYDLQGDDAMRSLGVDVAELSLAAAKLSMKKLALFPAMDMLRAGAKHLDSSSNRWSAHYALCLEIYSRLGEIGVQLGQHEDAMKAVQEVEKNAECIDDKFRAHCAMLTSITSGKDRDYDLGVEKTIEILKVYGERLPRKLRPWQLFFEKNRLKSNLPKDGVEGLLDLPKMEDRRAIKVTKLLLKYLNFFAIHSQKYKGLRPLATLRSLNIACKNGLGEMAASGVLGFAIDLKCAGHYQEALNYGQFAIGLVDKFPQRLGSSHCTVRLRATSAIFAAVLPFGTCLDNLLEAHRVGLKVGDTEKALCAIVSYAWGYLCVGLPIEPFQSDLLSYGREAKTFKLPYPMQVLFKIWQQAMLHLQTEGCENPTILVGDAMDQEEELTKVQGGGKKMTLRDINTIRLMLACIFNDWDTAQEMIDALEEYHLSFDILISRTYLRTTYLGLASFALGRATGQKKYRILGKKAIKFFKTEVRRGSVNAFPILAMLEAEKSPSKEGYEKAIKTCARLGLSHHEAYMCERAGVYFLNEEKDEEWSRIYLDLALSLYKDWGASGKVNALRANARYSEVLTPSTAERKSYNTALKGRRRFSKKDYNLVKAVMGMLSSRAL
jgi:predicted ATPase